MTWQGAVAVAVGEPLGLEEVRRRSSCHLPDTTLTHQATLPGTGWHRLIGLSVRMPSWSEVGFVGNLDLHPYLFISAPAHGKQNHASGRIGHIVMEALDDTKAWL